MLLGFSWMLVACFVAFQYHREKIYKVEKLEGQLQLFNAHMIDALQTDSIDFLATIARQRLPIDGLRVSVVGVDGSLVFDNTLDSLPGENHLDRHEISEAMRSGHGFTIRRHSRSTDNVYFYSATRGDDLIVRSAVPYSLPLHEVLEADRTFLWFMGAVTLAMSVLAYFATRRIGRTVTRLNRFAEKAERGESVYDTEAFPHDELGSISTHIIRLYARLQRTMEERDSEHRRAMYEQEEKNRIKKQLTNNINHELKTPVASILVCLELLRDHPEMLSEEKKRELNDRIFANAQRLNSLLKDVAAITRMDEGEEMIEKAPVDLAELVNDVVTEERLRTSMNITVDMPQLKISGNRQLLESIFRNLIDNAISYSGGSEIVIKADSEGNFTVSDNGCGVPDEHLPHIFERFYRIDKGRSRAAGGTGLGLSIVRNAVGIHGSDISVTNNGGLQFRFRLH